MSSTTTKNDDFHTNDIVTPTLANSDLFENTIINNRNGINDAPIDFQQLFLRAISNSNNGEFSTLMNYAHQLNAVAAMTQQFGTNMSPARKTVTKKHVPVQQKRTSHSNNSSPSKTTKNLLGESKHNTNTNHAAAINEFWANFSSSLTASSTIMDSSAPSCSTDVPKIFKTEMMETEKDTNEEEASTLPRECDAAERKRPAAIQELLQMKKARLNNNSNVTELDIQISKTEPINENELELKKEKNSEKSHSINDSSVIQNQWCSIKEDDTETTSSVDMDPSQLLRADSQTPLRDGRDHQQLTLADAQQFLLNSLDDDGNLRNIPNQTIVDLLATLNSNGVGENHFLKAMQSYSASVKINETKCPSTNPSNSLKSSPSRLPSRANDTDVCESPFSSLVPHDRTFAHVPGRLSLLSNVVKYKMSVGEVKRRLMGPESFNFSLLGALLRRAKMPEKSQMLVEELNQVGLSIPRGRRRLSQVTLLSALTESESVQFAKDFQRVAEAEFPVTPFAELSARRALTQSDENSIFAVKRRSEQLSVALALAHEFVELLDQDRSPVMDSNPEPIFDRNIQDPLFTFSMLTHGFGTPAIRVGVRMLISFLERQQQALHSCNQ